MVVRTEPSPCPTCGGPSTTNVHVYADGDESRYVWDCRPCASLWQRRKDELRRAMDRYLPGLTDRTRNCLLRGIKDVVDIGHLRAMSDDDLLALRMLGRKTLAEIRAAIMEAPAQLPTRSPDPAVFWAARPSILNVVGG